MDTFGRLLHGAVGTILGAVGADESIGNDNKYYPFVPDDSSYLNSRYLQEVVEESATVDEMAGAGTNDTAAAVPTFAPTADPNGTDTGLLANLDEVPDQFNATAGLTDTEVLRTTCKLYGSIFLALFVVFLVVRKAFPGTYYRSEHIYIYIYICLFVHCALLKLRIAFRNMPVYIYIYNMCVCVCNKVSVGLQLRKCQRVAVLGSGMNKLT